MALTGPRSSPNTKPVTKDGKIQALFLIKPEIRDALRNYSIKHDVSMSQLVADAIQDCYLKPAAPTPTQTPRMGPLDMFRTLIDPK